MAIELHFEEAADLYRRETQMRFDRMKRRLQADAGRITGTVCGNPPVVQEHRETFPLPQTDSPLRADKGVNATLGPPGSDCHSHAEITSQPTQSLAAGRPVDTESRDLQRERKPLGSPQRSYSALRWTRSLPEMRKLLRFEQCNAGMAPHKLDDDISLDAIIRFRSARLLSENRHKRLYIIDDHHLLSLMRPDVDVETIVRNMRTARAVIPVPFVYLWGRSYNYTFILMEYVKAHDLDYYVSRNPSLDFSKVDHQIKEIVKRLARVNLAHNDLYPQNVLVDRRLNVVSIIDWDSATPLEGSFEYERRAVQDAADNDWDFAFRKFHSPAVLFHGYYFGGPNYDYRGTITCRIG